MRPRDPDGDRRSTPRAHERTARRLAAVVGHTRAVVYDALWPLVARVAALKGVLRSTEGRTAALVVVAYLAGVVGLGLSLFGDPADPNTKYGAAGIGLMGVTFACLFLLSVSVVDAAGDRRRAGASRRRGRGRGRSRRRDDDH